jgi:hypothetical protein
MECAVREMGLFTSLQPLTPHVGLKLVCASDGGDWGIGGISFWVTVIRGRWYVATWVPHVYSIPESIDVIGVVAAAIRAAQKHEDPNYYIVDPAVVARFGLVEIAYSEFTALVKEPPPE